MSTDEQEQEQGVEEAPNEVCALSADLTERLLAAHDRRKARAADLDSAKEQAKGARERLDAAQSLVNDLLDEAERGPQPEQTDLFEEETDLDEEQDEPLPEEE